MSSINPSFTKPLPLQEGESFNAKLNTLSFETATNHEVVKLAAGYFGPAPGGVTEEKVKKEIIRFLVQKSYSNNPWILELSNLLLAKSNPSFDDISVILNFFNSTSIEEREQIYYCTRELLNYTNDIVPLIKFLKIIIMTQPNDREFVYSFLISELELISTIKDPSEKRVNISFFGRNIPHKTLPFILCFYVLAEGNPNRDYRNHIMSALNMVEAYSGDVVKVCNLAKPFLESCNDDSLRDLFSSILMIHKKMSLQSELDVYTPRLLNIALYFWNHMTKNRCALLESLSYRSEEELEKIYQNRQILVEYLNASTEPSTLLLKLTTFNIEEWPIALERLSCRSRTHTIDLRSMEIDESDWIEANKILTNYNILTPETPDSLKVKLVKSYLLLAKEIRVEALGATLAILKVLIPPESRQEAFSELLTFIHSDSLPKIEYLYANQLFNNISLPLAIQLLQVAKRFSLEKIKEVFTLVEPIANRFASCAKAEFLSSIFFSHSLTKDIQKLAIGVEQVMQIKIDLTPSEMIIKLEGREEQITT